MRQGRLIFMQLLEVISWVVDSRAQRIVNVQAYMHWRTSIVTVPLTGSDVSTRTVVPATLETKRAVI